MKKQHSVSIVTGLSVGALVALLIGQSKAAVYAGVIAAGLTAWLWSLDWEGIRKEFDPIDRFFYTLHLLRTERNARKQLACLCTRSLLQCLVALIFMIDGLLAKSEGLTVLMFLVSFILWMSVSISTGELVVFFMNRKEDHWSKVRRQPRIEVLKSDWVEQVLDDERGTLASIGYMLAMRTANAFIGLANAAICVPYLMLEFANGKTRLAAACAMLLSGLHLGLAHRHQLIAWHEPAFFLSLGATMVVGAVLGQLIHRWIPKEVKEPKLFEFLTQGKAAG